MKSKKELTNEYKQSKSQMGIFRIRNLTNNRTFIDSSTDIPAKWNRHRTELKFGSHKNRALQADWNEHGQENFQFEVLSELKSNEHETVNCPEELRLLKQMVLDELNLSADDLY
jgi:hypothetical protein